MKKLQKAVIKTMAYRIGKCLLTDRLRQIGMTQQQLAEKMGVSKQQVNRWCNDRQGMTMETAKNIASLVGLNCSDELYEWKRIPSRN